MKKTLPVASLIGGVSQQPKKLRFSSQMERQENFIGTILRGLEPRHHTEHVAKLLDTLPNATTWHVIDRDNEEKYVVALSNSKVQVFDIFGNSYPIHGPDAPHNPNFSYLDTTQGNGNSIDEDLERPAYDSCASGSGWTGLGHETCASSADLGPFSIGKTFEIICGSDGFANFLTHQMGTWPAAGKWQNFSLFAKKDEIEHVKLSIFDAALTPYAVEFNLTTDAADVAPLGILSSKENYGDDWYRIRISVQSDTGVAGDTRTLQIQSRSTIVTGDKFLAFGPYFTESDEPELPDYLLSNNIIKALTVADTTFVVNSAVKPELSDSVRSTSGTKEKAFINIIAGNFDTEYAVTLEIDGGGSQTAFVNTWDGSNDTGVGGTEVGMGFTIQTDDIAQNLRTAIDALGLDITTSRTGSVIQVTGNLDTTVINKFRVKDSSGNSLTRGIWKKVDTVSDLPLTCRDGFVVEVVPDSSDSESETTHVRFEAEDESQNLTKGSWVESMPNGIRFKFDDSTMPHQLVRRQDNEAGDVTGVSRAVYFEWSRIDWDERLVGDDESNPSASFVNLPPDLRPQAAPRLGIAEMFFHKGRLGFLSGTNVILSSVGQFFNFWRTTVLSFPDDDPIDIATGQDGVHKLRNTVELENVLLVFSDRAQMRLDGGAVLTPSSASLVVEARYATFSRTRPLVIGKSAFFPYFRSNNGGLYEFTPNQEEDTFDAEDHNAHVPTFINGSIQELSGSAEEKLVIIRPKGSPEKLVVFKYDDAGIRRIQNAWSEFSFGAVEIQKVAFVRSELFMVVSRADGVFLEKMDMSPISTDRFAGFAVRLDRRVTDEDCSDVYNSVADQTTITLPYEIEEGDTAVVTTRKLDTNELEHGVPFEVVSAVGDTIIVSGQATDYFVGFTYLCETEMTPPVWEDGPSDGSSLPSLVGTVKLRRLHALLEDTSFVQLAYTSEGFPEVVEEFTGKGFGEKLFDAADMESAEATFPLYGDADDTSVVWRTESHLPVQILQAEWSITRRSRERSARR